MLASFPSTAEMVDVTKENNWYEITTVAYLIFNDELLQVAWREVRWSEMLLESA